VRRRRRGDRDERPALALRALGARRHLLAPGRGRVALGGGQRLGAELDDRRRAVLHEDVAVTVEDLAARRLDAQLAHAVVARLLQVLVARQHLEVPQAEEDDREQHERDPAEDGDPQRELRRDRGQPLLGGDGLDHARESGERPPVV
jgi:hypothetical protein